MSGNDRSREYSQQAFSRNRLVLGDQEFNRVSAARAAVVGIGGVGSVVCEQLVRLGVRQITYFARGSYELGNVNRQIPATYISVKSRTDKIHALAERLYTINPYVELEPVECDVVADGTLISSELRGSPPQALFNCVDECWAQALVAEHASSAGIPCIIGGVTGLGLEGIVSVFWPGGTAYRDVFPEPRNGNHPSVPPEMDKSVKRAWIEKHATLMPEAIRRRYTCDADTPYPVLTPLPWIVASFVVLQFVKIVLGETGVLIAPQALLIQPHECSVVDLESRRYAGQLSPWRP